MRRLGQPGWWLTAKSSKSSAKHMHLGCSSERAQQLLRFECAFRGLPQHWVYADWELYSAPPPVVESAVKRR